MKKTILMTFILLFVKDVKCQVVNEKGFGVQLGYHYQSISRVDFGLNYLFVKRQDYRSKIIKRDNDTLPKYNSEVSKKSILSSGLNFSIHGFFNGSNFIFGQSIGYSIGKTWNAGLGLNTGIGIFNYSNNDFRLNPTIGISLAEVIYLNYTYAIPLNSKTQNFISTNQVGITIRYNPAIIKALLNNVK